MNEIEAFATLEDVALLWRTLKETEEARCEALLPVVSELLRQAARNVGKDLDAMIEAGTLSPEVAKAVTVDVTARVLRQNTDGEPVSQMSQSALGYSFQAAYAIPGGGVAGAIMNNDLKRLGLVRRQRIGLIEMMTAGED